MTEYDNTNSGMMARNEKRAPGSKQPEFKGVINAGGQEYWLSAWVKESKAGKKYFSISLEPKDVERAVRGAIKREFPDTRHLDDEIPFGPEVRG